MLLAIVLLLTGSALLLRSASVQTILTQEIASYYSNKLHTRVTIGEVDVEFIKKLVLRNVYIQDLHKDTLLYLDELKMDVTRLSFKRHELSVSELELVNPKAKLIKYSGEGNYNFQFLVDAFAGNEMAKNDKSLWSISCDAVSLINLFFVFRDQHDTVRTAGINYSDLECKAVNGKLRKIHLVKDTIYVNIENLSAREKCGFVLSSLSAKASVSPAGMKFDQLELLTPGSHIHTDFRMKYQHYSDFSDFITKVEMSGRFDTSRVEMADIAYFAPALNGMHRNILFSGDLGGKINELNGRNMKIQLDKGTFYKGDIQLRGLPDVDKMRMNLRVEELVTNREDLQRFPLPPFSSGKTLEIPVNMASLGAISFSGRLSGLLADFVAKGTFSSALGSVSSDISLRENYTNQRLYYSGKINSQGFDIGRFLMLQQVGRIALDATIDGSGVESDKVDAKLAGTISSLGILGYAYKNAQISAQVKKSVFDGTLILNDANLKLKFDGSVDFRQKIPQMDFNAAIQQANLTALGLVKTKKQTSFSAQLDFKVQGNTLDNLRGFIDISNTQVIVEQVTYSFKSFNLSATEENSFKHLKLVSDFLDCEVSGKYILKELGISFENLLSTVMPAYFSSLQLKVPQEQKFDLKARFNHTGDFTHLFLPSFEIGEGTVVNGMYHSKERQLSLNVSSPGLKMYGSKLDHLELSAQLNNKKLELTLQSSLVGIKDSMLFKNFNMRISTKNDSSALSVNWANHSYPDNSGTVKAKVLFGAGPDIRFSFLPSEVVIADSVWVVNSANLVHIDTAHVIVQTVEFSNNRQRILINGSASRSSGDSMIVRLSEFNLANLNRWTNENLKLKGFVNGQTTIAGIYSSPVIISNTTVSGLKLNNELIGDGYVKSSWEIGKDALALNGSFGQGLVPNIVFSGFYYPNKGNTIDLNVSLNAMRLDIIKPFVKEYCRDFEGEFSGDFSVKGPVRKPELNGKLNVDAKKITVNYLGTSYSFKQDILIAPASFGFDNMVLYDQIYEQNLKSNSMTDKDKKSGANTAFIKSGKVYHDNFRNFRLDFDIVPRKLMVLNTTENDNNLYYGQAYVTGPSIKIYGLVDKMIFIDADVKTERVNIAKKPALTKLFIPLSGPSDVSESNFISFVTHDTLVNKKNKYKVDLSGFTLDFDLDVTTDAEVHLIFDQKVGDIISVSGTGPLKLEINTLGKFDMLGNYTIDNGDYLFTLQNVINKRFNIEKGGTIRWSGNPYEADINLNAVYKVKTTLGPLAPPGIDSSAAKRRYPVNCKLILSNKLMAPDINFDIDLPTVDESTRSYVRSVVNSDLEMNRQAFSLMVLGSFVTPQSSSGAATNTDLASSSLAASTELLSNQLSNMLGKVSKDFDLGVKIAGDKVSNEELQVALSTQLLNNRLSIDGNFGKSGVTSQNSNTLVGDVNAELKLTDDGKLRFKAFNRTNDNTIINLSAPYTQGIGIFYREEFNTLMELRKRYLLHMEKKKQRIANSQ